jgi:hypothetical protein
MYQSTDVARLAPHMKKPAPTTFQCVSSMLTIRSGGYFCANLSIRVINSSISSWIALRLHSSAGRLNAIRCRFRKLCDGASVKSCQSMPLDASFPVCSSFPASRKS